MGAGRPVMALSAAVWIAACGGGETTNGPTVDDEKIDGGPLDCTGEELGDVEVRGAVAFKYSQDITVPDGPQVRSLSGFIGEDVDLLLFLWDGRGFFAGGAETGTFPFDGTMLDPETCAICLTLLFPNSGEGLLMVPVAGEMTLESIDGDLTGSAADIELQEIRRPDSEDVPGECTASITSMRFDAPLQD
jgi:hypothetical protein